MICATDPDLNQTNRLCMLVYSTMGEKAVLLHRLPHLMIWQVYNNANNHLLVAFLLHVPGAGIAKWIL